jgi:hypothetical protein
LVDFGKKLVIEDQEAVAKLHSCTNPQRRRKRGFVHEWSFATASKERTGTLFASNMTYQPGVVMSDKEALLKRISELESMNDQLLSEIRFLDELMREIGFDEGLKTLKAAAQEILEQDRRGLMDE